MTRLLLFAALLEALASCGCTNFRRWQVDLTDVEGFHASKWDGKVRIVYSYKGMFAGWKVDRIELEDRHGHAIFLELADGGNVRVLKEVDVDKTPLRKQRTATTGPAS